MKISVGVSNRHVHLKQSDLRVLFGEGYELHNAADLTQPGMFKAEEVVTIKTDKAEIKNVRVIATGGLGRIIFNETNLIDEYDKDLKLKGLYYISKL